MVVLALTFFVRGLPGAFKLYVGEAKDERLMPNVVQTARAIWYISVVYLVVGTAFHWMAGVVAGQSPARAFLHGLWVFMAAWSTGGFAPMNQNVLYYHSLPYEIVTIVFFVIGSFNFNFHWAVWTGNRKELYRNLEIVTFVATSTLLVAMASWELAAMDVYPTVSSLFRRGYYSLISAHTTTGFMTTYARQFALEWGHVALVAITTAMLFGGSATSTAGGFKAVRIGLTVKALAQDVKKLLLPESALAVQKFHMTRETVLDDRLARTALSIIALYMAMWGCLVAIPAFFARQYGWDIPSLMFEAASVSGNVGLSIGVTNAGMPWVVKVAYIAGMWLGRLEFLSVFVLVGYLLKGWRSR